MWMMGYNDGGEFNMPDAFSGRKLRPLMPRPASAASAAAGQNPSPSLTRIHGTDFISINHHLASAAMAEQNKRDYNTQQVVVSSRWNPTPEQLQTLEELYRRGTRTPSAEQIQHITAQLRRYGKIEGKNVFYWFQNHKARERQKRRRQLESASDENPRNPENIERKEQGANRTGFEVEQTIKNWATPTNCSTLPEKTSLIQTGATKAAADGWLQFNDADVQQRKSLMERNDTWQTMQFSCSSLPTNLINSTTTNSTTVRKVQQKLNIKPHHHNHQDFNIFIAPFRQEDFNQMLNVDGGGGGCGSHGGGGIESEVNYEEESQTLQLFPLTSGDGHENVGDKEIQVSTSSMDTSNVNPYPFFEFLPVKD